MASEEEVLMLLYLSCSYGCPVAAHPICGVAGISPGSVYGIGN